jgi:hypothetical protein
MRSVRAFHGEWTEKSQKFTKKGRPACARMNAPASSAMRSSMWRPGSSWIEGSPMNFQGAR